MMVTIIAVLLVAVLVLVALLSKNSVLFQAQFFGARVHLEAKGKHERWLRKIEGNRRDSLDLPRHLGAEMNVHAAMTGPSKVYSRLCRDGDATQQNQLVRAGF